MGIDWKARFKNPAFWIGLAGCVMSPILAYNGLAYEDLTTWKGVGDLIVSFVGNPYLIGSTVMAIAGFLGVAVDTSTPGLSDGDRSEAEGDGAGIGGGNA